MNQLRGIAAYRLASGIALASIMLLVWAALGVGIIGADGDPANRMYLAVVAIGLLGSVVARFKARGMLIVTAAMATMQALIATYAILTGLGQPYSGPVELALLNGFFIAGFGAAAWLYSRADG